MPNAIDIGCGAERDAARQLHKVIRLLRSKGVRVRGGAIIDDGNDTSIGRVLLEDAKDTPQALHILAAAKVLVCSHRTSL